MSRRGQVALFVIIAVVLIGIIVAFFAFRDTIGLASIHPELEPVFDYYTTCIDDAVRAGTSLAGSQGGRVEPGAYTPGSDYAPFSSHLFFAGTQVPYWFMISGNGITVENVPTRANLESELEAFVSDRLASCDFSSFREQGFSVNVSSRPHVELTMNDRSVDVRVVGSLVVSRADLRGVREIHDVQVSSKLGSFLNAARTFYTQQQQNSYFDNYAADILRLYAPVDGVSVQCAPEIWKTREVFEELQRAFEANFAHIQFSDTRSSLNASRAYFTIPHRFSDSARVLYSSEWPVFFEVTPADDELMVAEPVGNQKGLGVMGFCYVPYHFLYDIRFPVMVQLYDGQDVFQFPIVVLVDKNAPRSALSTGVAPEPASADVCSFKEGRATISTFDVQLNPVEAEVFYQCFDQRCPLGETRISEQTASLNAALPVCTNGQLIARAENYSEARILFSSNSESFAELILERLHSVRVDVLVDGRSTKDLAIIHFTKSDGTTVSALLPEQPSVMLGEGLYNISVYVYGNSSVSLPSTTRQECTQVPRGGIAGFFGSTEERCFAITSPETNIDSALRGGGRSSDIYLLESDVAEGRIALYVNSLPAPTSFEQLQTNFELFDAATLEVGAP
ncbi:MAG: hypothetical protein AABX53_02340 [Nanoarchaeota archaeon]